MQTKTDATSPLISLMVLTLTTWGVLTLVSGVEQIFDPLVRNDDYPAYLLRPDWYYAKTLQEGRWITYLWHLRPFHTPAWLNYQLFLLGSALFAASLSLHALGIKHLRLAVLSAAVVAVSPQGTLLAGWFNSLIPGIWLCAIYALLTLFASPAAGRRLLFIFVPLTLLSYSTYPLLLFLVCLARVDNHRCAANFLSLTITFAVAFALGIVISYGINWIIHGVFGLEYSSWRSANLARDLSGLASNIPVLLESYRWWLSGLGFGNVWLGIANVAAFFCALLVVGRRSPIEACYLLASVVTGVALLSLLALKDGVFIFFRATQFIWAGYGVVLARACVTLFDEFRPQAKKVVVGMTALMLTAMVLAKQTYTSLTPFQRETRRIVSELSSSSTEIRIYGDYTNMPEVSLANVQHESGLRLRLQSLSGLPTYYCASAPEFCKSTDRISNTNSRNSVQIQMHGEISLVQLPNSKHRLIAEK